MGWLVFFGVYLLLGVFVVGVGIANAWCMDEDGNWILTERQKKAYEKQIRKQLEKAK